MYLLFRKKLVASVLLAATLGISLGLPVHQARAQTPVTDVANTIQSTISAIADGFSAAANSVTAVEISTLTIKEYVLDPLANIVAQTIIRALTNQIIGWIQGNDAGFVQNLDQEFRRAVDAAGGEFLNNLTGLNLCGNLGAFLNITLRTPGLRQRIQCTLTDIVANVNSFFTDFQRGGWPAFIRLSFEPQNTAAGAYLIALDAKIEAENRARERVSVGVSTGRGFLGFRVPKRVCTEISADQAQDIENSEVRGDLERIGARIEEVGARSTSESVREAGAGRSQICQTEYETKTPGSLIADGLSKSVYSGLDSALLADEINEAIAAIVTALINKVITASTGSGSGVFDRSLSSLPPPQSLPEVQAQSPSVAFFAQRIDDSILRLQGGAAALDGKIKAVENKLFPLQLQLSALKAACAGTISTVSCDQGKISQLESERGPLETEKAEHIFNLSRIDEIMVRLLEFRGRALVSTDPGELRDLNARLTNLLVDANIAIQKAGGPQGSPVTGNPTDNALAIINNGARHTSSAILLLDQKISLASSTTATTTITIEMQSLRTVLSGKSRELSLLLDSLTALRLRIESTRLVDPAGVNQLVLQAFQRIQDLQRKITDAYKL